MRNAANEYPEKEKDGIHVQIMHNNRKNGIRYNMRDLHAVENDQFTVKGSPNSLSPHIDMQMKQHDVWLATTPVNKLCLAFPAVTPIITIRY